jgi:hypothetical protein
MTFNKFIIGACALLTIVIGTVVYTTSASNPTEQALADTEASVTDYGEYKTEEPPAVIAEFVDPFDSSAPVYASFTLPKDSSYNAGSRSVFTVDTGSIILPSPSNFKNMGFPEVAMGDNGHVIIIYEYRVTNDTLVTWEQGSVIDTTNRWKDHLDTINLKPGDILLVMYSTEDGGASWTGEIQT